MTFHPAVPVVLAAALLLAAGPGGGPRSARAQEKEPSPRAPGAAGGGRQILMAALEKRGGMRALRAIRDYVLEMKGQVKDPRGEFVDLTSTRKVLFGRTPCVEDRSELRWTFNGVPHQNVLRVTLKGNTGDSRIRSQGRRLSGPELARHWAKLHRSTLGILRALLDPAIEVKRRGPARFGDTATEVVEVQRGHEPPLLVDVDPGTGHFLRVRWRERPRSGAPPRAFEIRYADFKDFGALRGVPRRAEVRLAGDLVTWRRTVSVKVNTGLKVDDFQVK